MAEFKSRLVLRHEGDDQVKLEEFIERICDRYNIFNSYFGSMLYCLNEVYAATKCNSGHNIVKIFFSSSIKGIQFRIYSRFWRDCFIAAIKDASGFDKEEMSDSDCRVFAISVLADSISVVDDVTVILDFDINSIHSEISRVRLFHLTSYFAKIQVTSNFQNL